MIIPILKKIFSINKTKIIDNEILPSQGWFYPEGYTIEIQKGSLEDQVNFHRGLLNSNIFGVFDIVKNIIERRVKIYDESKELKIETLKSIDLFYLFIEFVKFTTGKSVYFNEIEFKKGNFIYFDFEKYEKYFDYDSMEFIINGWKYSPPSIGVETSLNHFSYEIAIRGTNEKYGDGNYNLVYFLGHKMDLSFDEINNLLEIYRDLSEMEKKEIDEIVIDFSKSRLYFIVEAGKTPVRINPHQLKTLWPIDLND